MQHWFEEWHFYSKFRHGLYNKILYSDSNITRQLRSNGLFKRFNLHLNMYIQRLKTNTFKPNWSWSCKKDLKQTTNEHKKKLQNGMMPIKIRISLFFSSNSFAPKILTSPALKSKGVGDSTVDILTENLDTLWQLDIFMNT